MSDELIEIDGAIEARTEKAVLFHTGDKSKAEWLPRSQIKIEDTGIPEIYTVSMPEWMAVQRGFV